VYGNRNTLSLFQYVTKATNVQHVHTAFWLLVFVEVRVPVVCEDASLFDFGRQHIVRPLTNGLLQILDHHPFSHATHVLEE